MKKDVWSLFSVSILALLISAAAQNEPPQLSEDLVWDLASYQDDTETEWMTTRFATVRGALYTLEHSSDLEEWVSLQSFYARGDELHLTLFPLEPNAPSAAEDGAEQQPPPEPDPVYTYTLRPLANGNEVAVSWESGDENGEFLTRYARITNPLVAAWSELPIYSETLPGFTFVFMSLPDTPVSGVFRETPSQELALEEIQALAALKENFTTIQENITTHLDELRNQPFQPLPHNPFSQGFYRLKRTLPDSDGDGIPDWLEYYYSEVFGLQLDPFSRDSNGDGIDDQISTQNPNPTPENNFNNNSSPSGAGGIRFFSRSFAIDDQTHECGQEPVKVFLSGHSMEPEALNGWTLSTEESILSKGYYTYLEPSNLEAAAAETFGFPLYEGKREVLGGGNWIESRTLNTLFLKSRLTELTPRTENDPESRDSSFDFFAESITEIIIRADNMSKQTRIFPVTFLVIESAIPIEPGTCEEFAERAKTKVLDPLTLNFVIAPEELNSKPIMVKPGDVEALSPPLEGKESSRTSINLLPVELRDVNGAGEADDIIISSWDKTQDIADNNIAWIDAHQSAQNSTPRMPQLEFGVQGLPEGLTVEAKLNVQYTRGNGTRAARSQAEDRVIIPANGKFAQVNGDTWQLYNEAGWQTELTERGFFGGEATLTYKIKQDGDVVFGPEEIDFRIGGENPDDARCRTYIESRPNAGPGGNLWFAYAIAKSESRAKNGEASRYNQFFELPIHRRDVGRPVWGNDGGTLPGGYGMFQITGNVADSKANIPRREIWDWRENVHAGLNILTNKRKIADDWMAQQRNAQNANGTALPNHTVRTVTFAEGTNRTMNDAVTIKLYNGASRPPTGTDNGNVPGFLLHNGSGHYCFWRNASNRWTLNRFNNPPAPIQPFNYVDRVCQEVEN